MPLAGSDNQEARQNRSWSVDFKTSSGCSSFSTLT
jgi:hypothetical protein